jgi:hypothetical protein
MTQRLQLSRKALDHGRETHQIQSPFRSSMWTERRHGRGDATDRTPRRHGPFALPGLLGHGDAPDHCRRRAGNRRGGDAEQVTLDSERIGTLPAASSEIRDWDKARLLLARALRA